ncbi:hypothetical protein [Primorskyibacter flagellatus]|uniref:ATP-binding protein n=1 Tax=Primorskyibacter flagellatus TaxID=1387277 RepID=A0A1W2DTL6_9RHOB|nr:hypothetical protein [Primorskyibacter flagellatus]SMD00885.1 hypothetical protein SAMN06295998_1182 [Primorskyibacter flagellatus]
MEFSKINEFGKGKSGSFEALVKVLARREQPEHSIEFQPNDGRGGDGGVEAIWINSDGTKIGYQAKYFETLGNAQWTQMDKSVATALENHPQLTSYIFALPFDLTPKRKQGRSGDKSQQEKWDERVAKWKALAAKNSITIEFELWDETALTDKLLQEGNGPLVKLWFGGDVLDDQWFEKQVASATLKLDDRFNPDDHVEVSTASMFDAIVRGPAAVNRLHKAFNDLANNRVPTIEFTTTSLAPDQAALKAMTDGWDNLVAMRPSIDFAPDQDWVWPQAQEAVGQLRDATWKLEHPYNSMDRESVDEKDRNKLEVVSRSFRDLSSATSALGSVLRDRDWLAEAKRCALVFGEAGSGKSHLLGQTASERVREGLPTVVVLGQDLSEAPFWPQFGDVLGLTGKTAEDILGVLNASGERKGQRILLLFDAINEGVGASYWMHWLPEVVAALRNYPYIAAVFSCRDVYTQYAIPKALLETLPVYRVEGFITPDERERAAIQYLDKKGISRPNTPWLSPEFSNPLFLKSTSEALLSKGETEFPRGLRGLSELMLLYLEGLSVRTGLRTINAGDMSKALTQYVRGIAVQMANDGNDYVTVEKAHQIAEEHFGNRQPPEGKTWLDVFTETSLLRRDPPPYSKDFDPLDPPSELIRFSFQRFQDFLMADTLIAKIIDMKASTLTADEDASNSPGEEFLHSGPLNFIFYDGDPEGNIRYDYAGLVGALSTIYPEKIGCEFAMSLPNWEQKWEQGNSVQDGFGESFKWRRLDAFTKDTRELLNRLDEYFVDPIGLLLEVSMTIGHPFNAERLHDHLGRFKLAERDSYWTQWINWSSREEFSQIDRIVSWALSSLDRQSDERHLQLASLVLAWSLSSSHMTLRDRATKALITVFLKQPDTFEFVLSKMHDCDDPYIIERLYAAAFGACCIDPTSERLKHYSQQVFAKVFAYGKPPVALLTRDYALGLIELAESKTALSEGIQIADCYPPFGSDEPEFDLTKEQVEAIADQRGGKSIFQSASSEWGDYGKYSIPGRVSNFLTTRLSDPAPLSATEIKDRFEAEVISPYPDRVQALEAYNQASIIPIKFYLKIIDPAGVVEGTEAIELDTEKDEDAITKEDALSGLRALLSDDENRRLTDEYFNDAAGHGDYSKTSVDQCRLWITKRAYELGWTKELFPRDGHGGGYSRHENDLERIGKKYQRIALDELQARLADNYWTIEGWPERPHQFKYSHNEYRRNIEPTVLPTETRYHPGMRLDAGWMSEPMITLPKVQEADLKQWPFTEDPTQSMSEKLVRVDANGKRWLVLYEFHQAEEYYSKPTNRGHGKRYDEFRFFYCVLLKKGYASEFAAYLEREGHLNVHDFQPRGFTNGPYLGEAYWRDTWQGEKFDKHIWKAPAGCEFAIPISNYHWESNLDKTLPDGFSNYMPQKWFADELGVNMSGRGPQYFEDANGNTVLQSQRPCEHQTAVVIDEAVLLRYVDEHEVEPVWIMVAERNTWPGGVNDVSSYRRSEGAVWLDGTDWQQVGWNNDTNR